MTRELFNTGWSYRAKVTPFQELGGSSAPEWTEVLLPHDALIAAPRSSDVPHGETNGYFPGGAFEYRKTFVADSDQAGRQTFLEFDGVYRDASIFVNGNLAGQRANGYSRFLVQIDPYLRFGAENEIRVECRSHLDSRWYAGAGVYRDVHLISKDLVHIANDGVRVTTPDIDLARAVVDVEVDVANASAMTTRARLALAVGGSAGEELVATSVPITLLPGSHAPARHRFYIRDPHLWGVDAPALYSLRLELLVDDVSVDDQTIDFGIRSLQLDPMLGLRINGETVKLRGACIHSDNGPLGAISMLAAELRRVRILKEAGFNAIRSAHNPASSALLDACDRLGMLVIDETFDMWTSGKSDFDYSFDFPQWWERDVESMVLKDVNHPSVIFYSIGNEIPETGTSIGATWGRRLVAKVRSLDPSRFVTNGINGFVSMLDTIVPQMNERRESATTTDGGVNTLMAGFGQMMEYIQASEEATARTEESYSVLDVAGMNYSHSRYESDARDFPDRIIVGTETWPCSIVGNWALVERLNHVIGDFTWTGWDYLGETGLGAVRYTDGTASGSGFSKGYPELTAWCGDIDITGRRRPFSYFRESVFGLRSDPYIAVQRPENHGREIAVSTPWSWTDSTGDWSWPGFEGSPVIVEVYADADEVELLLNEAVIGRSAIVDFRAQFETTYQTGELVAIAYRDGIQSGRYAVNTEPASLQATADRTRVAGDGTDLVFLDISIGGGADRAVSLHIEGPAVLQGFGSGSPVTTETFHDLTHRTFDGHALAVIRPTGRGPITVTAAGQGLAAARIDLIAT